MYVKQFYISVFGLLGIAWVLIMMYIWFPNILKKSDVKDRDVSLGGLGAEAGGRFRAPDKMRK